MDNVVEAFHLYSKLQFTIFLEQIMKSEKKVGIERPLASWSKSFNWAIHLDREGTHTVAPYALLRIMNLVRPDCLGAWFDVALLGSLHSCELERKM